MKNICFFIGDITRSGGTERVAAAIGNGLARLKKYHISFLSIVEQKQDPHFQLSSEIKRYSLKDNGRWISPGPGYLPLIPKLRHFLKATRQDILIDIDIVLDVLSIPAAVGLPVKVVSWEHFHYYFEQDSLYRRWIARFSARFSDFFLTLTQEDMHNYQDKLHRRNRIDFIYNPMTEPEIVPSDAQGKTELPSASREKMLITVGHLEEVKGTDLLAQIVPRVLESHPDWKWYFLGDGSCRPLLEQVLSDHHLAGRLVLTGIVPDVESYLRRASIFVLGSRTESFGMCLLEARACGVPCVSFDVPYGPGLMITDSENGFLIPPFHLEQMADRISQLIEDEALRERFSKNTLNGMEPFRLDAILQKWELLLDSLQAS